MKSSSRMTYMYATAPRTPFRHSLNTIRKCPQLGCFALALQVDPGLPTESPSPTSAQMSLSVSAPHPAVCGKQKRLPASGHTALNVPISSHQKHVRCGCGLEMLVQLGGLCLQAFSLVRGRHPHKMDLIFRWRRLVTTPPALPRNA